MRRKLLFVLLTYLFLVGQIYAAGFNLKSISGVDTSGRQLSCWWYTGLQPTFSGEAPGSSAVDIIIDSASYQTAGNAAGEWEFTPPAPLSAGDHQITLKNNDSTIAFTLTLGKENVDWNAVAKGGGETLPAVGFALPTLFLIGSGLPLILIARLSKKE